MDGVSNNVELKGLPANVDANDVKYVTWARRILKAANKRNQKLLSSQIKNVERNIPYLLHLMGCSNEALAAEAFETMEMNFKLHEKRMRRHGCREQLISVLKDVVWRRLDAEESMIPESTERPYEDAINRSFVFIVQNLLSVAGRIYEMDEMIQYLKKLLFCPTMEPNTIDSIHTVFAESVKYCHVGSLLADLLPYYFQMVRSDNLSHGYAILFILNISSTSVGKLLLENVLANDPLVKFAYGSNIEKEYNHFLRTGVWMHCFGLENPEFENDNPDSVVMDPYYIQSELSERLSHEPLALQRREELLTNLSTCISYIDIANLLQNTSISMFDNTLRLVNELLNLKSFSFAEFQKAGGVTSVQHLIDLIPMRWDDLNFPIMISFLANVFENTAFSSKLVKLCTTFHKTMCKVLVTNKWWSKANTENLLRVMARATRTKSFVKRFSELTDMHSALKDLARHLTSYNTVTHHCMEIFANIIMFVGNRPVYAIEGLFWRIPSLLRRPCTDTKCMTLNFLKHLLENEPNFNLYNFSVNKIIEDIDNMIDRGNDVVSSCAFSTLCAIGTHYPDEVCGTVCEVGAFEELLHYIENHNTYDHTDCEMEAIRLLSIITCNKRKFVRDYFAKKSMIEPIIEMGYNSEITQYVILIVVCVYFDQRSMVASPEFMKMLSVVCLRTSSESTRTACQNTMNLIFSSGEDECSLFHAQSPHAANSGHDGELLSKDMYAFMKETMDGQETEKTAYAVESFPVHTCNNIGVCFGSSSSPESLSASKRRRVREGDVDRIEYCQEIAETQQYVELPSVDHIEGVHRSAGDHAGCSDLKVWIPIWDDLLRSVEWKDYYLHSIILSSRSASLDELIFTEDMALRSRGHVKLCNSIKLPSEFAASELAWKAVIEYMYTDDHSKFWDSDTIASETFRLAQSLGLHGLSGESANRLDIHVGQTEVHTIAYDFGKIIDRFVTLNLMGNGNPMEIISYEQNHGGRLNLKSAIRFDVKFVTCDEVSYKASKAILAARSPYFKALFNNGFKDSKTERLVYCGSAAGLRCILYYLYKGMDDLLSTALRSDLSMCLEVLVTSNEYLIDGLSVYCELFLSESVSEENVLVILKEIEQLNAYTLRSQCLAYACTESSRIALFHGKLDESVMELYQSKLGNDLAGEIFDLSMSLLSLGDLQNAL